MRWLWGSSEDTSKKLEEQKKSEPFEHKTMGVYLTPEKRAAVHAEREKRQNLCDQQKAEQIKARIDELTKKGAKPFDSLFEPEKVHSKESRYLTEQKRKEIYQEKIKRMHEKIDEAFAKNPKEKFSCFFLNDENENPKRAEKAGHKGFFATKQTKKSEEPTPSVELKV